MIKDLHLSHPPSPDHLVVRPTSRDIRDGLALSTRNAYLSPVERTHATALYQAISIAVDCYKSQNTNRSIAAEDILGPARHSFGLAKEAAASEGVSLNLDYLSLNSIDSLEPITELNDTGGAVISGAMWCGKSRLLDNITLNYDINT